jgi:hypothetical protein
VAGITPSGVKSLNFGMTLFPVGQQAVNECGGT